jgi:hypothetical protein
MSNYTLRTYADSDAARVNELALAAFEQFRSQYSDWPAMASAIGRMSALADSGEIIVAVREVNFVVNYTFAIPPDQRG